MAGEKGKDPLLNSIKNLDHYIAEMRPAIDGSTAAVPSASR